MTAQVSAAAHHQKTAAVGRIVSFKAAKTPLIHEGRITRIERKRTGEWITVKHGDGSTSTFRRSQIV